MKIYKCDVCGKIINKDDVYARKSEQSLFAIGLYAGLFGNLDVCGSCVKVVEKIDFRKIALLA